MTSSVQRAHDELLAAMPAGTSHEACSMCQPAAGNDIEMAKEGASVADPKYTEEQHLAILADAVTRETASLSTTKDELEARVEVLGTEKAEAVTALTDAQTKIDVLEAEKAAETQRADAAEQELTDFKESLDQAETIEKAKTERVEAVKAADEALTDDYFTEERINRWAAMEQASFDSLVADLTEAAAKRPPVVKKADDEKTPAWLKEKARETAAFTGGTEPTAGAGTTTMSTFLQATGKLPAPASV